jgi:hypothetical protein
MLALRLHGAAAAVCSAAISGGVFCRVLPVRGPDGGAGSVREQPITNLTRMGSAASGSPHGGTALHEQRAQLLRLTHRRRAHGVDASDIARGAGALGGQRLPGAFHRQPEARFARKGGVWYASDGEATGREMAGALG